MRSITKTINVSKTTLITGVTGFVLAVSLVASPAASALSIGGPSDCDDNAIIRCGTHSTGELMNAYRSSAYVQKVYASFGISNADIGDLQATNVAGKVTRDGRVFVEGQSQAVANNAITGGRQNMPGSTQVNTQGVTFFKRPPSASFQQAALPAFVAMKNGQFQFAIIASCGNAVRANAISPGKAAVGQAQAVSKPTAKPVAKAAPAPTQTQSQSQSQEVNVNNININEQSTVQTTKVQKQPQPTPATPTEQPAAQQSATQPTSLVNTGPAGLVATFIAASAVGVFAFRQFLLHKVND
jgi:hypothetical protein